MIVAVQQSGADQRSSPPPSTPLLVFADDWGRHPSSCQHLIARLLPRRPVIWVNTIMRPPRWNMSTVRRGWEKARQWLRPPKSNGTTARNPQVCNPRMWPWFASRWDRNLNRWLLRRQLQPKISDLDRPPIAITTLPIAADLIGHLPVQRWVYYCVDDFSQWPGLDGPALQRMERRLVENADEIIVVSDSLRQRVGSMGRSAHLLTHGLDLDTWTVRGPDRPASCVQAVERPLIVFWGVIDRRMDSGWVRQLSDSLSQGTIVFVGPHDQPDAELLRTPRSVFVGSIPYADLPRLAREASVLIMPYRDIPVTRAIQPLKLKEYLATGKPVVARHLPATREWADSLDLADSAEQFVQAVHSRLTSGLPEHQRVARHRLADESWDSKASEFERWIDPQHERVASGRE